MKIKAFTKHSLIFTLRRQILFFSSSFHKLLFITRYEEILANFLSIARIRYKNIVILIYIYAIRVRSNNIIQLHKS